MLRILRKKIGIVGFGNMGAAIAERIRHAYPVLVFDKDRAKTKDRRDVAVAKDAADLVGRCAVVILAVKPQDFDGMLAGIRPSCRGKLLISIAAGITTGYLERVLGTTRIIRVMPNLPALVGRGISCMYKGRCATDADLRLALGIFSFLGVTFVLDSEAMMDAATGVAGSGPGFWCDAVQNIPRGKWEEYNEKEFIPLYSAIAEAEGFGKKEARLLAETVAGGSLMTLDQWHIDPAQLKQRVASKGGTTEAGLNILRQGGSLADAVKAAIQRARELSQSR